MNAVLTNNKHIEALHEITRRLALLSNIAKGKPIYVSFDVEWASRPSKITIVAHEWKGIDIVKTEAADWYFSHDDSDAEREALFSMLSKWEDKYGLQ